MSDMNEGTASIKTRDILPSLRETQSLGEDYNTRLLCELAADEIERLRAEVAKAVLAEQDRCCAIIYGQASSDNVAARTVAAIRARGGK